MKFLRRLKILYYIFRNAFDPQPQYVFELSNSAAQVLSPDEVQSIMAEIYARHPQLESLRRTGKQNFETDLQKLKALPAGSLGHEYAQHMLANDLDPNFYTNSKFSDHSVDQGRWEYFRVYSLQSHDIWHVLSGYRTDYLGEIGVFSFLFGQISLALYLLIAVSISMHTVFGRKRKDCLQAFENLSNGFRMGRAAKSCLGLDWDQYWSRNLEEIRKELKINLTI